MGLVCKDVYITKSFGGAVDCTNYLCASARKYKGRGRLVWLSHTFSLMFGAALGLRVVRGPDWEGGDQDGGEGFVGTVVGLEGDGRRVTVQWDMGQRNIYHCGQDNKFDLRLLESGPSGESSVISAE